VALCEPPAALAQTVAPSPLATDIPAQPLAQALAAFAKQTGLQLVYVSAVLANRRSHAVSAGLSVNETLTRMLMGTGLKFEYLTPDTVRILPAAPPDRRLQNVPEGEPFQVIVTANRREESVQDVPITIQAITGEHLNELGVTTFNDLQKYTTNITYSGNGPGTGNIFIRGLGSLGTGNQSQSTIAPFPNVALLLDDQSMQFPARNNDVYLVDMARVEVLEGPQGTLFGGGAQAGVIRYVTNKPNLTATSGEFNAGYGLTAGGDQNSNLNAVLNVPLIPDTLAVRGVMFSERRGGYISNVPGTIAFLPGSPAVVSGGNPIANNANMVRTNTNPITYGGLRLSGLYQFHDDWSLLIQQSYQDMNADGYFYAYPFDPSGKALQPYQITAFTSAYTKDRYESTTWTLDGKFGELKAVYSGSYLMRHIEGQQDYSNYLRSAYGSYYACIGSGAGFFNSTNFKALAGKPLQCYPPVATWHDSVQNEHQSHELRVSTSEKYRVRALLGAYWEKFVINDNMNFNYLVIPQCTPANLTMALAGGADCLSAVGPLPGTQASDPSLRENMNNAFGQDVQRGYKQYAFFISVDFDLIPKVLTLSGGTRRYHYDEFQHGSQWYSETIKPLIVNHPNGACTAAESCGLPINLDKSESGFQSRANLTWHVTPDLMAYYTYSEGFRPGGFNRTFSLPGQAPSLSPTAPYCAEGHPLCLPGGSLSSQCSAFFCQYTRPVGYKSDNLINNEFGFKSELLNHRVLLNVSAYQMKWNNAQSQAPPSGQFAGGSVTNGPSYTIKGVELQLIARVTDGLTLQGSSSWNRATQTDTPCLHSVGVTPYTPVNPTPAGQCITVVLGLPYPNPWGVIGTPAPFSPPFMFNVRARYDWSAGVFRPFVMIGASHIASMFNEPANFPDGNDPAQNSPTTTLLRYTIPGYTTYDGAIGVSKEDWTVQLTGKNLSNSDAATNISSAPFIKATIPLRPRVLMAEFTYRF